jgi:hypothetical protein
MQQARSSIRSVYGLGGLPIKDLVAFIQKTFMCSKADLRWMASGPIDNFPVTPDQIDKYSEECECWILGHLKKRRADNRQFGDVEEYNLLKKEFLDSRPPEPAVTSVPPRLIEERNEVIGHEVGTDIFGPYVGATIVTSVGTNLIIIYNL